MMSFLLAFAGTLFLGSTGAFFLFVPPMSIATVALLLMAFMLMFWLGFQAANKPMPASDTADEGAQPRQAGIGN